MLQDDDFATSNGSCIRRLLLNIYGNTLINNKLHKLQIHGLDSVYKQLQLKLHIQTTVIKAVGKCELQISRYTILQKCEMRNEIHVIYSLTEISIYF